ncbi:MAG TPA: hypothetical protein VFI24_22190 [Pyrinomonadaceae bacterium]|nr:hypothetical protein [Pyrinomonadaceae bacterium]
MSKKIKGNLWLLLIIAVSLTVAGFAATGMMRGPSGPTLDSRQKQANASRSKDKSYVNRSRLSPKLVMHLNALGNRLEKPGKERISLTGELRSSSESQPRELTATLEFPDKLQLGIKNGQQNRLLTFADQENQATRTPLSSDELDLIESVTYDSAEHFFNTQMQGNAMRFLGSRFRMDDGSSPDYNGPYYDVYKIADRIKASGEERAAKLYYFNSDTLLLERVTYVINRNGSEISVETKLGDWRDDDGQKVARRIERLENGRSVFILNIRSTQFGRRADDGIFLR